MMKTSEFWERFNKLPNETEHDKEIRYVIDMMFTHRINLISTKQKHEMIDIYLKHYGV